MSLDTTLIGIPDAAEDPPHGIEVCRGLRAHPTVTPPSGTRQACLPALWSCPRTQRGAQHQCGSGHDLIRPFSADTRQFSPSALRQYFHLPAHQTLQGRGLPVLIVHVQMPADMDRLYLTTLQGQYRLEVAMSRLLARFSRVVAQHLS
ncbi:hypothetical protein ACJU26_07510 [Acidithiobacillus sp. M4-SHS-6]|uniref:hypothetical protein n=1 Tax=Acidithiobacillus sp. M4-SHS-6 TaxID=3383024 RepID=UPI0039BE96FC